MEANRLDTRGELRGWWCCVSAYLEQDRQVSGQRRRSPGGGAAKSDVLIIL